MEEPAGGLPAEVSAAATNPDQVLGDYVLIAEIGTASIGSTWKAYDQRNRRWVALKWVPAGIRAPLRVRFLRESRTVSRIRHPNMAAVHDVGEREDRPFVATEFITGKPFNPKSGLRPALETLRKAALALTESHRAGIIHRGLKPSNILVDEKGDPRMVDFGMAYLREPDAPLSGSATYLAPEERVGDIDLVTPAVDVYSIGVMMYEAMAGSPPAGDTPATPPGTPDLQAVCLKALSTVPTDRYPTARELADDLGRFLAGEKVTAQRPNKWQRGLRWAAQRKAATGAVILGIFLLFAFLVNRHQTYSRLRGEAMAAWKSGEWATALARADGALAARILLPDKELAGVAEECRAKVRIAMATKEFDALVVAQTEALRTLRSRFYNPNTNIPQLLADVGKHIQAIEAAVKPEHAELPQRWAVVGLARYLTGDWVAAEPTLLEAERRGPNDARVTYALGRIAFHAGSLDAAVRYFDRAIKDWSGERPIELLAARAGRALAANAKAELRTLCDEGIRLYGKAEGGEDFWMYAAASATSTGDRMDCINKALSIRPVLPTALYARALLHLNERNDPYFADLDFTSTITCNPNFAPAWKARGTLRMKAGRFPEAIEDLERALQLTPADHPDRKAIEALLQQIPKR